MGSEHLSHLFAVNDPTFKENSSSSKHKEKESLSQHSMSHTSGTQPVSLSNGPKSSQSPLIKHKRKPNAKHRKLLKLYNRQLCHINTTLNAIESLSELNDKNENEIILSNKKRVEELKQTIEDIRNDYSKQDHIHFDQLKDDIDQLINNLESYKTNNNDKPDLTNTIDYLVGLPLDVSESEDDDDHDDENKTLIYF